MATELKNYPLIGGPRDGEYVAMEELVYGGENEQFAPAPLLRIASATYLRTPVPDGDGVTYEYHFEG